MSMFKISYGFTNASGKSSWDTSLSVMGNDAKDALLNWAKYKTQFVLKNLTHIDILEANWVYGEAKWYTLNDSETKAIVEEFIKSHKGNQK